MIGDDQAPIFTHVLDVLLQDKTYKDKVNAILEGVGASGSSRASRDVFPAARPPAKRRAPSAGMTVRTATACIRRPQARENQW